MGGVIAVVTGDDLSERLSVPAIPMVPGMKIPPHPLLARGAVHAAGTPVAAVIAQSRALAHDAVSAIIVEYEALPAVVNADTSYKDAWTRSQGQIRQLIPMAEELKVIIAVEEVWNKFLLSPLEFARYVDEFQSPWVRAYFDVGNVVISGYPQDWIRTLGKRIVKLHLKDFTFRQDPALKKRVADFVMLRDGEIDWKEIYRALADIGYQGTATVELGGGDRGSIRRIQLDRLSCIIQRVLVLSHLVVDHRQIVVWN